MGYVRLCLDPNFPKSYILKSTMVKLFNTHQVKPIGKLITPGLFVTVARLNNKQKKSLKSILTLFRRVLGRSFLRRLPKDQYSMKVN